MATYASLRRCHASRRIAALFALTCLVLWASSTAWGQLPTTQLSSIFPPGGKFGSTVEVQVAGADQDDLTQLVFSHPGITATQKVAAANEFLGPQPVNSQFTVQIAGDVPPGVYEARVVGRFGISNPRAFAVGVYEELVEAGGNNQSSSAMPIALDKTVNGRADANNRDYFKLPLKPGQRVLIDCQAERVDSRMDATLVAFDPTGHEIARSRDYAGQDPLLDLTATVDGEYIIDLHDFVYSGGGDHFYRLTAHLGPHIDFVFPPAGLAGATSAFTLYGRNLPGGQPAEGVLVEGVRLDKLTVEVPLPADELATRQLAIAGLIQPRGAVLDSYLYRLATANPVAIQYAAAPVTLETEPNGVAAQVQTVTAPCEIAGQFYPARDEDVFQFAAKAGEVFYLELISHRAGHDVDPYLVVRKVTKNEQGQETVADVANVDDPGDRNNRIGSDFDTSTDDPGFRLAADQDAIYRIAVRDQFGGLASDPRNTYRLTIRPAQPDFRVIAVPTAILAPANPAAVPLGAACVRRGGTTMYQIQIERRDGFAGELEVTAEGLPEGVTCLAAQIGANANSGALIFTATENAPAWTGTIRVLGKARINDQDVVRYARGGSVVWDTANRQTQPPAFRAAQDISFAVIDKDPEQALVEVGENKIWETSKGGQLDIPVKVTRRADFKADLTLAPLDVPNEFKPGNVAIKGDAADGKLELKITNGNAKPGLYTFYLRADSKIKHVRNPDAAARATEDQKKIDLAVQDATQKLTAANEGKTAATKAAQDAAAALKVATDAKTAADAAAKQAAEAAKVATDKLAAAKEAAAKDAANAELAKAVAEAEKASTEAEQKNTAAIEAQKAADKTLADSQQAAKTADEAKVAAEKLAADTDAKLKQAQAVKASVDKTLADVQKANNPADKNVAFISTPIRLRIVDTPLKLTATAPANALKQGEKLELPVAIERLYGFADAVEVAFELPKGVNGVSVSKLALNKDQAEGKFEVTAAKDATPGDHAVTIKATAKFNNVAVETVQSVVLKIEKVEAAQ